MDFFERKQTLPTTVIAIFIGYGISDIFKEALINSLEADLR